MNFFLTHEFTQIRTFVLIIHVLGLIFPLDENMSTSFSPIRLSTQSRFFKEALPERVSTTASLTGHCLYSHSNTLQYLSVRNTIILCLAFAPLILEC